MQRDGRAVPAATGPALHALQSSVGWISEGGLNYVCERLSVPPADAYGVATFYAMFSVEPRPGTVVHVCDDLACRVVGAASLIQELEGSLGREGVPKRSAVRGQEESTTKRCA